MSGQGTGAEITRTAITGAEEITRVGVVGGGQTGAGIAEVCTRAAPTGWWGCTSSTSYRCCPWWRS